MSKSILFNYLRNILILQYVLLCHEIFQTIIYGSQNFITKNIFWISKRTNFRRTRWYRSRVQIYFKRTHFIWLRGSKWIGYRKPIKANKFEIVKAIHSARMWRNVLVPWVIKCWMQFRNVYNPGTRWRHPPPTPQSPSPKQSHMVFCINAGGEGKGAASYRIPHTGRLH